MAKNIKLFTNVSDNKLYVNIKSNDEIKRQPCNIITILDVSGSMNDSASKNMSENDRLSRLDLLKHTCLTIINLLNQNDTLGIVTFSTDAKIKQTNIYMTDDNKKICSDIINSLETEGTTNIYDGLVKGFNLLDSIKNNNNNSIILLTDGVSNVNPPAGILGTFKEYSKILNLKPYNLNTFGFSENIDSKLLRDISDYGNGVYGFIPDASMVGTCFINYASSVLSTYMSNVIIEITYEDNTKQIENTGSILLEQDRELLINLYKPNIKNISLKYNNKYLDISNEVQESIPLKTIIRYDIINTVNKLLIDNRNAKAVLDILYNKIKTLSQGLNETDKKYIENYINDYENDGQISIVFSKDEYIRTWGVHYLLSLLRSYEMQICLNFKDNGLQNYANKLFSNLRDEAEIIFLTIPPPVRKIRNSTTIRPAVNMSNYYNSGGSCYDGNSDVKMFNNTFKKVKDLVKGDEVLTKNNNVAKIVCVIITKITKKSIKMCNINGMYITPYHPIIYNNQWKFPIDCCNNVEDVKIELIYNLVLSNDHVLFINNTPVVSLGHNINENVVRHNYLGTNNVINDLSKKTDYISGVIMLNENDFERDTITNEIIKIN